MTAALFLTLLATTPARDDDRIEVLFAPTGEKHALQDRLAREIRSAERDVRIAMFHFPSNLHRGSGDCPCRTRSFLSKRC